MKTRNLSIAVLVASLLTAVILSFVLRPVSQVTASYRAAILCEELVKNGGFETLYSDWTIPTTAFPADYSTAEAHSGVQSMRLGIPPGYFDGYAYSSIYQDVTIPSSASSATLSFWYKPYTQDSSGWDRQQVFLYDTSWVLQDRILSVLSNSRIWTQHTFDVSSYAGETLRLYFSVYNNPYRYYGRTWMYVDDVSLQWCGEVTPTPTHTPTPTATPTPISTPHTELAFSPSYQTVFTYTGALSFTTDVVITDVSDLGAFEFDVVYDPDVVRVARIQLRDFLGRTGRTVESGYDSTLERDGRYSFWAYSSCPADPGRPGPTGKGVLATTFLSPIAPGETDLAFQNARLFDTGGRTISFDSTDGYIVVEECFGDFNGDGVVDIVDVMTIAGLWGCESGVDACYDSDYDFNDNGEIDVGDIMQVVDAWGPCEAEASALLQAAKAAPSANVEVKIEPEESTVDVGKPFSVTVVITDVTDLGGFQFDLKYDPALLQVNTVTLGDFLGSTGRTAYLALFDNEGSKTVVGYTLRDGRGPDGHGVLANIVLTAQKVGEGSLQLENVKVADTELPPTGQIPTAQGAEVMVSGVSVYLPLIAKE